MFLAPAGLVSHKLFLLFKENRLQTMVPFHVSIFPTTRCGAVWDVGL